jgi:hypothetical protein
LIQQPQYTPPTPKYNFPLPTETLQTLQIPQKFIEISLKTTKTSRQKTLQPPRETTFSNYSTENLEGEEEPNPFLPNQNHYTLQSIPLEPIREETTIVAIDVSSMKIGETNEGIICAIRGAIVWKERNRYKYLRIGPFPLHVTEKNKTEIYHLLRQHSLNMPAEPLIHSNLVNIPLKLGNLLERWIKMEISCTSQNSIILWDGSLTAGTNDNPTKTIAQILEIARNRLSTVLAFSKTTQIRLQGHQITDLTGHCKPPYLLQINGFPTTAGPIHFLGDVHVAKLTSNRLSFRLDIDKEITSEQQIEAVQRLLGNDILFYGYPETLRLAHIYSTFTATEVIGIQRFITKQCKIAMINRPNIRRILFGSFGKGPEEA